MIDIQSHTYDLHRNTSARNGAKKKNNESLEAYSEFLAADVAKMKEKMIKFTGQAPVALAYPYGAFSKESDAVMKASGISVTFTCTEKVNTIKKAEPECLFGLGRYNRANGISSESFFERTGII